MGILKVSSKSNSNSVVGALVNVFRKKGTVEMQTIGAGALNQAVKAVAIARGFVAPAGKNLISIPAFTDVMIDGEERTAIKVSYRAYKTAKKLNLDYIKTARAGLLHDFYLDEDINKLDLSS